MSPTTVSHSWLQADEERVARIRAPLAREQCQHLSLAALCQQVRQSLQQGDRIGIWLYAQWLPQRLGKAELPSSPHLDELAELLEILRAATSPLPALAPTR